jgi:hypothetical protein
MKQKEISRECMRDDDDDLSPGRWLWMCQQWWTQDRFASKTEQKGFAGGINVKDTSWHLEGWLSGDPIPWMLEAGGWTTALVERSSLDAVSQQMGSLDLEGCVGDSTRGRLCCCA